jgi:hypothetical protein
MGCRCLQSRGKSSSSEERGALGQDKESGTSVLYCLLLLSLVYRSLHKAAASGGMLFVITVELLSCHRMSSPWMQRQRTRTRHFRNHCWSTTLSCTRCVSSILYYLLCSSSHQEKAVRTAMTFGQHKFLAAMLSEIVFDQVKGPRSYSARYPKCFEPISLETIAFFFTLVHFIFHFDCKLAESIY